MTHTVRVDLLVFLMANGQSDLHFQVKVDHRVHATFHWRGVFRLLGQLESPYTITRVTYRSVRIG